MIVGTAGHIDHGKTTLVKALTGVDTDRLPEEKKRGISIELGYAFLDLPGGGGRIGFIDVPGHERLVHTMLAGATGVDYALLLVAADDGVMPQTREHLAVLSLLGLHRGAVVVTKADRADAARLAAVEADAAALIADTALQDAPVLAVSAFTGAGLDALRARLVAEAAIPGARPVDGAAFRLAIDRAFTLDGVGTVVTGSVHAGRVRVGDELVLVPGSTRLRVRSLHAQNRAVQEAQSGQRCAIGLAGIERAAVQRGQWLVAPVAALSTDRLDATLTAWHGETRALRSGTPVHVHLGSATVPGSVAVLDADSLAPGRTARVQLVLRAPQGAWHGDRVVLRDASASRTIAGGIVLDPFAPTRYRRTAQRFAELDALSRADADARLAAWIDVAPHGLELQRFAAAQGLARVPQPTLEPPAVQRIDAASSWALGPRQAAAARHAVLDALARFHATQPEERGPDVARLRRLAVPRLPEPLWRALLEAMQRDGAIAVSRSFVHLPAHGVELSASERRIAQKIAPMLGDAGFEGAWARDLARDAKEPEALMRAVLARLAQQGEFHQVVRDLYYPAGTMARLARIARDVAAEDGSGQQQITAAQFRDATQLGRKRAIQLLEYFDRIGLLRRVGDAHRLRTDSNLFAEEGAA